MKILYFVRYFCSLFFSNIFERRKKYRPAKSIKLTIFFQIYWFRNVGSVDFARGGDIHPMSYRILEAPNTNSKSMVEGRTFGIAKPTIEKPHHSPDFKQRNMNQLMNWETSTRTHPKNYFNVIETCACLLILCDQKKISSFRKDY